MSIIKNDFENGKINKEDLLNTVKSKLEEYNIHNDTITFYQNIFFEMYLE